MKALTKLPEIRAECERWPESHPVGRYWRARLAAELAFERETADSYTAVQRRRRELQDEYERKVAAAQAERNRVAREIEHAHERVVAGPMAERDEAVRRAWLALCKAQKWDPETDPRQLPDPDPLVAT